MPEAARRGSDIGISLGTTTSGTSEAALSVTANLLQPGRHGRRRTRDGVPRHDIVPATASPRGRLRRLLGDLAHETRGMIEIGVGPRG